MLRKIGLACPYLLALLLSWIVNASHAQSLQFAKRFGLDEFDFALDLIQTQDRGYLMVGGTTFTRDLTGGYLIKTDSTGKFLWAKAYGGNANTQIRRAAELSNGDLLLLGVSTDTLTHDYDVEMLRTDSQGNMLWVKDYDAGAKEYPYDFVAMPDGGFAVTGWQYGNVAPEQAFVMRMDASGNMIWANSLGGPIDKMGTGISRTHDGGLYVGIWNLGDDAYHLLRLNGAGQVQWIRNWQEGGASNVIETADHGVVVAGQTYLQDPQLHAHIFVRRTDSTGQWIWSNRYRISGIVHFVDLWPTSGGGYIVEATGVFGSNSQVVMLHLDGNGNLLSTRQYGGIQGETIAGALQASDGGFALLALGNSFGNPPIYLLKTDSLGEIGCVDSALTVTIESLVIPEAIETNPYLPLTVTVNSPARSQVIKGGDGPVMCSNVGIGERVQENAGVYPNPSQGRFTMDFPISRGELIISDLLGHPILQQQIHQHRQEIQLDVPPGIYPYRLIGKNGEQVHGKVQIW